MSSFTESSSSPVEQLFDYPVDTLPTHITESTMFKMWRDLCPVETVFPYLKSNMVDTLCLNSHADFTRLIEADCMFQFNSTAQKEILKNMYEFWLHNPDSSMLPLPVKDKSHFSNQVLALFLETASILPVNCFKCNHVELFEYLVEREGLFYIDNGRFPDYTLPYYGVRNNHLEIVRRGLELGVSVAKDCIDESIKQKNLPMFNLLLEHKVRYTTTTLEVAAKTGLPEMYEYFLRVAFKQGLLKQYVHNTLHNKDNLEYLLFRSGINLRTINETDYFIDDADCIYGIQLLEVCINKVCNVEILQMIEEYFDKPDEKPLIRVLAEKHELQFILKKVIHDDNFDLFMYLHSKGFMIKENLIDYAVEYKTRKLTPGLLRHMLAEQQKD
jgi:hypothetical protein